MNATLGSRLATILRRKKMKISELSRRTGIHRVTLSKLVHDRDSNPTVDTLRTIADALKIGMDELVSNRRTS